MNRRLALLSALSTLAVAACGGGGEASPNITPASAGPDPLMPYGFSVSDSAGRLVVSDTLPTLHFIGRATYVGVHPTNSMIFQFDISSPGGAPMPFVEVPAGGGRSVRIVSVELVSGTTYRISVYASGDNAGAAVWCFAPLTSSVSSSGQYGLRVLDASGKVTYDSTLKPLTITRSVDIPAFSSTGGNPTDPAQSVASSVIETRPAVFCAGSMHYVREYNTGGVPVIIYVGAVEVNAATLVRRTPIPITATSSGAAPIAVYTTGKPETCLFVDISKYV